MSGSEIEVLVRFRDGAEELLIGRDVLSQLVMHYDGPNGRITPSHKGR